MGRGEKNNPNNRGFFRFMSIIGAVTIGSIVYAFLEAAPDLSASVAHLNTKQPEGCLSCHVQDIQNAPIIPHRPMPYCTSCHSLPSSSENKQTNRNY